MTIRSILTRGTGGLCIDIECHLSNNLPNIIIVGFANKAVGEARERIRGAFASSRIILPRKRVLINLAPADVPKADSSFDLAIAMAIIQANGQLQRAINSEAAFIGELGLDGSVRPVRGIIGKLLYGRSQNITTFYIPAANLSQAQLVPNITVIAVQNLGELFCHFTGLTELLPVHTTDGTSVMSHNVATYTGVQLSEIVSQEFAKRALEIAAAGGHNVLLSGPPGTGKSMLAKAIPSILPPLAREEMLEVTHVHSLASYDYEQLVTQRPFRAPHHSASPLSIIGGGLAMRPGEISLGHRGVLFLDELPEFSHDTLEALRQPLEDRKITITRHRDNADFPANFMLVATANPCPCGYYGAELASQTCSCSEAKIKAYEQRLSGPILDRIDLYSSVNEVNHDLLLQQPAAASDTAIRGRVQQARAVQRQRFGSAAILNADMHNDAIRQHALLTDEATSLLGTAAQQQKLSARAYMRAIKVARTIADIEQSTNIESKHMSEAIQYRARIVH